MLNVEIRVRTIRPEAHEYRRPTYAVVRYRNNVTFGKPKYFNDETDAWEYVGWLEAFYTAVDNYLAA